MTRRRIGILLVVAEVLLVLLVVRNFFYVTAWRLYLDGGAARAGTSSAAQRFEVEAGRVLPVILTPDDDRLRFALRVERPSTLRFEARPKGRASYEVALVRGSGRQVLARGEAERPVAMSLPLPPFEGMIELAGRGSLTWVDLRIVRDFRFVPHLAVLAFLVGLSLVLPRLDPAFAPALRPRERETVLNLAMLGASVVAGLAAAEASLRLAGPRLGARLANQRRNLGEAWPNPRWQETARYGTRMRAGLDTFAEVGPGDIVWMGFLPPEVAPSRPRRFPFHTDGEGFRNAAVRDPIAVAALGDSFTDATTLPAEQAWPARLEARLGVPVQNYGTAAFGPQQEERVLEDFALRHRPQAVVVAFFAGNDIFNAETFDEHERDPARAPAPPGWRIKDTVARFDGLYLVSLVRAGAESFSDRGGGAGAARADGTPMPAPEPPAPPASAASFDRGMFTVPVAGRTLRVALMPPYLNTLRFSADDLRARPGWRLTRRSFERMQQLCRAGGSELVVMFVPFKSQVYLPPLRRSFPTPDLQRALAFYFRGTATKVDAAEMEAHRLAQNELMRAFCAERGLAFLDLTPVLEAAVESGRNVYFPDDSHWNAAGHDVAAAALAEFLTARGLLRPRP